MVGFRKYIPFQEDSFETKQSSVNKKRLPKNSITSSIDAYATFNYVVGATAPVGLNAGGIYGIFDHMVLDDNTPDGKYWDINAVSMRQNCTRVKGHKIPEPAFDLSTGVDVRSITVPIHIDLTNANSPGSGNASIYDMGANSYYKEFVLSLFWAAFNTDGVLFQTVNTFAIDESSIELRYVFNQHVVPSNHEVRRNPEQLLMRSMFQETLTFEQAGRKSFELEQLRDYTYIHISGLKEASGLLSATDELFNPFDKISLQNSSGTTGSTFYRTSWKDLEKHTIAARNIPASELVVGHATLPIIDDARLVQALNVVENGDVNLIFDNLKLVAAHTTRVELTFEHIANQDKALSAEQLQRLSNS